LFGNGFVIGCYRSAYPADEVPRFLAHDPWFTDGWEETAMKLLATLTLMPEANDATAAERLLAPLPLVAAEMFRIEWVELRPFVNWSMLFAN
jgi:hypothetical protein